MTDPNSQQLTYRASQLRALAEDIAALVDAPHNFATTTMKTWSGPHADRVRGELRTWRTKCTHVAEALRQEAHKCDRSAMEQKQPTS
ncbi:WXG100 family type VII secretion target [Streptomyces adustus]|uniref:WXG100 family type VII secretion target n=1 Tax=Streptomyces adustus TaxID=1609272 RepID=UPI00371DD8BF